MTTPATVRWGIGGVVSLGAAILGAHASASLLASAWDGIGVPALMEGVLGLVAGFVSLLCLYLALVSVLAAAVHHGPRTGIGRGSLGVLRRIAPSIARRIALGLATAGAVTSLSLGSAMAANLDPAGDCSPSSAVTSAAMDCMDTAPGPPPTGRPEDTSGDLGAPDGPGSEDAPPAPTSEAPPSIGWVEPAPEGDRALSESGTPGDPRTGEPVRTVVVQQGDTLWSITDRLLGPGPDAPGDIQRTWPELHEHNRDVIGDDPDTILPGQVLVVPAALAGGADEDPGQAATTDQEGP